MMEIVKQTARKMEKRIGVVGLVIRPTACNTAGIQEALRVHEALIIGKMEIPKAAQGQTVMALLIEATTDEVGALTGKLGTLPDVRVKTSLV
jgi:putative iron-only hydrogenase system regulator